MTENETLLTITKFAVKVHYSERQIRQMCIDGKIKAQKLNVGSRKWLIPESELNKFGGDTKLALQVNIISQENWIEDYEIHHRELPMVPEFVLPVVKDKTARRVSKSMELSVPSAQWWNGLLHSQKEQVLQMVDWLGQNRHDYLERINRQILGKPSDIRLIPKRKLT